MSLGGEDDDDDDDVEEEIIVNVGYPLKSSFTQERIAGMYGVP